MADKQRTIELLTKCLQTEESAIPIYARHIDNALFFSGFSEENKKKINEILNALKKDSVKHEKIFLHLLKKVKESPKDVF